MTESLPFPAPDTLPDTMNPATSDEPAPDAPNPPEPAVTPADQAASEPLTVHNVVFGPDGLRPIWGILLFLALLKALRYSVYPIATALFPVPADKTGAVTPRAAFVYESAGLLCVFIATWLMARFEQRPVPAYGFRPQRGLPNLFAGLASGVALLSLLIAILRGAGLLIFDARLLFGGSILRYAVIWLAGFLLVALLEESLSRGYLQFTLARGLAEIYRRFFGPAHANSLGFWTAAVILSFCFGYGHRANPGESPLGMLSAGLAGFLFCFSLWRTGSLWWAIGFHASWDWAQSFLYGVADSGLTAQGHLYATHPAGRPYLSGGLTGPEGSLFLLPVMLAGVAVVLFTLPRSDVSYLPAGTRDAALH
jgi:membrane protease YdiL (CAAX protease family)